MRYYKTDESLSVNSFYPGILCVESIAEIGMKFMDLKWIGHREQAPFHKKYRTIR